MEGILGTLGDHLGSILAGWATFAAAVLSTVEGIGQSLGLKPHKKLLAIILGPALAVAVYWVSGGAWVDVPLHGEYAPVQGDELRHLVGAGLLGLFSTALAMGAHNWALNPVLRKLRMK